MRRAVVYTLIAGVAPLGAAPATAGSGKPQRRKVELGDNFYAPTKLTDGADHMAGVAGTDHFAGAA